MRKYLVETFMKKYLRKPFFGSSYIYFNDYVNQSAILTNYSLSLGLLFKNDMGILLELLGNAKSTFETNIEGMNEIAEQMENDISSAVNSSFSLFSETVTKKTIEMFFKDKDLDYRNPYDMLKIKNEKIPVKVLIPMTEMLIYQMIAFSHRYPEKTKKLLTYKIDEKHYELAIKSGLDVPEIQEHYSLQDHLNLAKELIRPYIINFRPDLTTKLEM